MYNYPLTNPDGKTIGLISLETTGIPTLMMEGCRFQLGGLFNVQTRDFVSFTIIPLPKESVPKDNLSPIAKVMSSPRVPGPKKEA